MPELPEAGIGMIYLPGLDELIESHLPFFDLIELEPQTLWHNRDVKCDSFDFNREQTRVLQEYPLPKLFHSVGFPVGSSHFPANADLDLLNKHASLLHPLWISEHLSFNTIEEKGRLVNTNFLLPPLQTEEGIDVAVRAITTFRSSIPLPFAFETGVNYLAPKAYEIPDGSFVAEIAERSGSFILLDLHNIMANQLNGRQPVEEFIAQLPLERVAEIHIAGGFFHHDYYIDGHSGVSSNELLDLLAGLVRKLPRLKALVFEMLPEYAQSVSHAALQNQFEQMRRVWDSRGKNAAIKRLPEKKEYSEKPGACPFSVKTWEYALGKAAIGQPVYEDEPGGGFSKDRGIEIINELVFHFRASMIVTALPLSTRLLRLTLGKDFLDQHLKKFFANTAPDVFAFAAAKKYAGHLKTLAEKIPYLDRLLEYELASLETLIEKKSRTVEFNYNPFPVFRSLTKGELPGKQDKEMVFVLTIEPNEVLQNQDPFQFNPVYHN